MIRLADSKLKEMCNQSHVEWFTLSGLFSDPVKVYYIDKYLIKIILEWNTNWTYLKETSADNGTHHESEPRKKFETSLYIQKIQRRVKSKHNCENAKQINAQL